MAVSSDRLDDLRATCVAPECLLGHEDNAHDAFADLRQPLVWPDYRAGTFVDRLSAVAFTGAARSLQELPNSACARGGVGSPGGGGGGGFFGGGGGGGGGGMRKCSRRRRRFFRRRRATWPGRMPDLGHVPGGKEMASYRVGLRHVWLRESNSSEYLCEKVSPRASHTRRFLLDVQGRSPPLRLE